MQRTIFYLFVLAVLLLVLGYWAGANQLAKTGFAGINQLGLTFTGRNAAGQFAPYPSGGPQ
jgi:hypothetical protein